MAVMIAGVVAIIALVGWALTRTVEPAPAAVPEQAASAPSTVPTSSAPSTPADQDHASEAGVTRIEAATLKSQHDAGQVTIVDVRDAASYQVGHIPGALHVPFASVEAQLPSIPKDKPIVTYCT